MRIVMTLVALGMMVLVTKAKARADDGNLFSFVVLTSAPSIPENHVLLITPQPNLPDVLPPFFMLPNSQIDSPVRSFAPSFFGNEVHLMRDYRQAWKSYLRSTDQKAVVPIYNPSKVERILR